MRRKGIVLLALAVVTTGGTDRSAFAQKVMQRGGATVMVEPYAANIVRITLSLQHDDAILAPGYGISAKAAAAGWSSVTVSGLEGLKPSELVVTLPEPRPTQPPTGTRADIAKFFRGSAPWVGLRIARPDCSLVLALDGWGMAVPNYKDGTAWLMNDRCKSDPPFYTVSASFSAAPDEHDYGFGQNQEGYLDHRSHVLRCAHDYNAPSGQSICVPFLVTN